MIAADVLNRNKTVNFFCVLETVRSIVEQLAL